MSTYTSNYHYSKSSFLPGGEVTNNKNTGLNKSKSGSLEQSLLKTRAFLDSLDKKKYSPHRTSPIRKAVDKVAKYTSTLHSFKSNISPINFSSKYASFGTPEGRSKKSASLSRSPNPRSRYEVERFKKAAEEYGGDKKKKVVTTLTSDGHTPIQPRGTGYSAVTAAKVSTKPFIPPFSRPLKEITGE